MSEDEEERKKREEEALNELPQAKGIHRQLKKGEPVNCEELQKVIEEIRLYRDNIEMNTPRFESVDSLFSFFLVQFREVCPHMARDYDESLLLKYKEKKKQKKS